ncbi:hypothetical protein COJ50_10205 [Bacillus cereus]|uniref:Uncharacterized protein n=1 Tax=Bacillus cereus TaxID=1396 RepID=A0A2B1KRH6_BACCE|nr:hypothetical protein COJ50_10205 [Bacillus cereus]
MINGKPYTLRGVRTVWRGVLGNLLKKLSKAPGSYPTLKKRSAVQQPLLYVFITIPQETQRRAEKI